ncbi:TRAP transporter substrate-binding protein DctP [Brevibacterium litoralis]|uniref:TRAP transporter substrate-binding protein DctP n=1 Tax=Brevibacterium litoralis TaxID=3138935 RepID=UPI0032EC3465
MSRIPFTRTLVPLAAAAAGLTLLAGCAGGVSTAGGDGAGAGGEGFAYGASQEEVDAAIADLDPVTLVFQPGTSGPNTPTAQGPNMLAAEIEERSGGKITVQMNWGQSIAPHSEVTDALVDGRIDLAFVAAVYFPQEYPVIDAYNKLTQYTPASPLVGEAINQAVMADWGWNSEDLLAEFEEKGLTPLQALMVSGDYWTACTEPGTSLKDWNGRVMRIAGSAHAAIVPEIGASPVSLEYAETFEALERGTVDCTFVQPQVAGSTGLMGVAPHLAHFTEGRMTGSATAAHLLGSKWETLPLAYQQIIFDSAVPEFEGNILGTADAGHQAVLDLRDANGTIEEFDPEAEAAISDVQDELVQGLIDEGRLPEDVEDQIRALSDKWEGIITEELGYSDAGTLADFDDWYEPGDVDFRPLAERVYDDVILPHRPE